MSSFARSGKPGSSPPLLMTMRSPARELSGEVTMVVLIAEKARPIPAPLLRERSYEHSGITGLDSIWVEALSQFMTK